MHGAAGERDRPSCQRRRAVGLMGHEDHRGAGRDCFADEVVELVAPGSIEARMRLVEQPQLRAPRHDGSERCPPSLAGAEAACRYRGKAPGQAEAFESRGHRREIAPGSTYCEAHVLGHGEVVVEERGVPEQPYSAPDGPPVGPQVTAQHEGFAPHHGHQAGNDSQERGFPGTIGSLHEHDLTARHVEVDSGERGVAAEQRDGGAEAHDQVHERATTLPALPSAHPTGNPHRRLRRALRATGTTLIALGTLILAFVAYQLWGTNLAEARQQRELNKEFARLLAAPAHPAVATTSSVTTQGPNAPDVPPTTPAAAPPPAPTGSAVAMIRIPRIGLEKVVVEGVGVEDLKAGPGHYPGTPLPGQPGNAAIAGHRTTYGAPFNRIDELQAGDPILVTTTQGSFRYEVAETRVVPPSATWVLDPTDDNRLTLTSCHPKFSARQRIVVTARLVGAAAPAPPPTIPRPEAQAPAPAAPTAGLSGESASALPTVLWGGAAALVALAVWGAGRRWRRWPAWLLGAPVFCAVLFVFFENVSRLLPANI